MGRESLMELWKEQTADFVSRDETELEFYAILTASDLSHRPSDYRRASSTRTTSRA
jgi:hypothetical protein